MWMVYALLAAVGFGARGILYHWTSQQPINRNLMLFGVFSTGTIIMLFGAIVLGQRWTASTLIGIVMGACSYAANAAMYKGFAVGKASLVAILTGLPPVVVAVLAYVLWGEMLTGWKLGAFGIILLSVLMLRYSNELSWSNLQGAQWGLLAMLFFGLNDISSKQSTLLAADMLPTLFFMFATGTALFGASWLMGRQVDQDDPAPSDRPSWGKRRTFLWGMAVGVTNAIGMMAILPAFKYGVTGLVTAVVSLNVLLVLFYARAYTRERFKRLEVAGIVLSLLGIVVLRVFP